MQPSLGKGKGKGSKRLKGTGKKRTVYVNGPPPVLWHHQCKTCGRKWMSLTMLQDCQNPMCGGKATFRKQRSDAYRKPKNLSIDPPLAFTRERRSSTAASRTNIAKILEDIGDVEDDIFSDIDDPSYEPPADFNPAMRLTDEGETDGFLSRVGSGALTCVSCAYTRVGARAARSNTNTTMDGESADDYAARQGQDPPVYMEWCHMVAACLGGPTTKANLFCGGYNANTHMLAIEQRLVGKTHLEVQIEAHCRTGTVFAEKIVYRVRKAGAKVPVIFRDTFDSLSTGFSSADQERVRSKLGKWLRSFGKRPS